MKIVIVAGGTGGHLFPSIRFAEEIEKEKKGDILFITSSRKQDRDILRKKNISFECLPVIGLQSKNIWHILSFTAHFLAGTIKSFFLILRFRPSVAVGFGGYISAPVLLIAVLLRIRTVIHEQNVSPGRTNCILGAFVDTIAVSFPEAVKYFNKRFKSKIIISGNLLRRELQRIYIGDNPLRGFRILVIGGSQGSHTLNTIVPESIGLIENGKKDLLEIIHISGEKDRESVITSYKEKGIKSRVFSFTEEMAMFYNESDFVISRAGATTVSELLYLGKPAILVPYPYAGGHQRLNAKVLEDLGCAVVIDEYNLRPEDLRDVIIKLMDRDVISDMSKRSVEMDKKDACRILVDIVTGRDGLPKESVNS